MSDLKRRIATILAALAWLILVPTSALMRYDGSFPYYSVLCYGVLGSVFMGYLVLRPQKEVVLTFTSEEEAKSLVRQHEQRQRRNNRIRIVVLVLLTAALVAFNWKNIVLLPGLAGGLVLVNLHVKNWNHVGWFAAGSTAIMTAIVTAGMILG